MRADLFTAAQARPAAIDSTRLASRIEPTREALSQYDPASVAGDQ